MRRGTWASYWCGDGELVAVDHPFGGGEPYLSLSARDSEWGMAVQGDSEFARRFADRATEWADAMEAYEGDQEGDE